VKNGFFSPIFSLSLQSGPDCNDHECIFRTGSCEEVDSLAVNIPLTNGPRTIGIFCGSKRPPKLMSNGVNLDVLFISHATSSTSSVKGFAAIYNFVTGQLNVTSTMK